MSLDFTKMNAAGNDFVLIDNRQQRLRLSRDEIRRLCDRQRGVGADGIFLLVPSVTGKADWAWEFYNRDGSTAEMCGNGARCFARFTQRVTGGNRHLTFETGAGVIAADILDDRVTVDLTPPHDLKLNQTVELRSGPATIHSLNTGVPHAVLFVTDADQAMVEPQGKEIRYHPDFSPEGTNVNFVELLEGNAIRVRTYERGVEGETLACGTGVTAAALIASRVHQRQSPVTVRVQSGDRLEVGFRSTGDAFEAVRLTGPAEFVFEGRIEL